MFLISRQCTKNCISLGRLKRGLFFICRAWFLYQTVGASAAFASSSQLFSQESNSKHSNTPPLFPYDGLGTPHQSQVYAPADLIKLLELEDRLDHFQFDPYQLFLTYKTENESGCKNIRCVDPHHHPALYRQMLSQTNQIFKRIEQIRAARGARIDIRLLNLDGAYTVLRNALAKTYTEQESRQVLKEFTQEKNRMIYQNKLITKPVWERLLYFAAVLREEILACPYSYLDDEAQKITPAQLKFYLTDINGNKEKAARYNRMFDEEEQKILNDRNRVRENLIRCEKLHLPHYEPLLRTSTSSWWHLLCCVSLLPPEHSYAGALGCLFCQGKGCVCLRAIFPSTGCLCVCTCQDKDLEDPEFSQSKILNKVKTLSTEEEESKQTPVKAPNKDTLSPNRETAPCYLSVRGRPLFKNNRSQQYYETHILKSLGNDPSYSNPSKDNQVMLGIPKKKSLQYSLGIRPAPSKSKQDWIAPTYQLSNQPKNSQKHGLYKLTIPESGFFPMLYNQSTPVSTTLKAKKKELLITDSLEPEDRLGTDEEKERSFSDERV